jgi:hypothetical protein
MEEPLEFMIDDSGEWSRKMEHLSKSTINKNLYINIYIYIYSDNILTCICSKYILYVFNPTSISEVDIAPIKGTLTRNILAFFIIFNIKSVFL